MADSYGKQLMEAENKLVSCALDLTASAEYYESEVRLRTIGLAVPEAMRFLTANIGWPRMYLDAIEERLDVEGFRLGDKQEHVDKLTEWWQTNQLDEESGMAHLDALIYGRSYVTVAGPGPGDPEGIPVIRVESPLNMVVDTDPRTRKVVRAVRLYQNPENTAERWAMLYLPNATIPMKHFGGHWIQDGEAFVHNLGVVPVVPILNRERLADRDGRSEITPEIRSFTDAASRIMMNMQAASELMAVPQRVLFGVDPETLAPNGSSAEVLNSYLAQILAVEAADGKAHQFSAAELMNFVNALEELAKHVASYTGLPPQYLSFSSENPASAEAIRSAESRLVKKCERKARMFGGAWEQVMRIAMLIIEGNVPNEMNRLEMVWRDPSTPTYAAKADGVTKLFANGQGIIPKEQARIDMGFTYEQREAMKKWDTEDKQELVKLADVLTPKPAPGTQAPTSQAKRPTPAAKPAAR